MATGKSAWVGEEPTSLISVLESVVMSILSMHKISSVSGKSH